MWKASNIDAYTHTCTRTHIHIHMFVRNVFACLFDCLLLRSFARVSVRDGVCLFARWFVDLCDCLFILSARLYVSLLACVFLSVCVCVCVCVCLVVLLVCVSGCPFVRLLAVFTYFVSLFVCACARVHTCVEPCVCVCVCVCVHSVCVFVCVSVGASSLLAYLQKSCSVVVVVFLVTCCGVWFGFFVWLVWCLFTVGVLSYLFSSCFLFVCLVVCLFGYFSIGLFVYLVSWLVLLVC